MPTISEYEWFVKNDRLGVGKESSTTSSMIAAGSGSTVRYAGVKLAASFIEGNLTQESEIPKRFHRALVAHVLMTRFEDQGNQKKASLWRTIWNGYKRDAAAQADKGKTDGPVHLKSHDL